MTLPEQRKTEVNRSVHECGHRESSYRRGRACAAVIHQAVTRLRHEADCRAAPWQDIPHIQMPAHHACQADNASPLPALANDHDRSVKPKPDTKPVNCPRHEDEFDDINEQ